MVLGGEAGQKETSDQRLGVDVATGKMKALTFHGKKSVAVEMVPKPQLVDPEDVIVKVTACSISSGTDSILLSSEVKKGLVLGHEACGVVESKGNGVTKLNVGDRVVIASNIACGKCNFCQRQEFSACDFVDKAHADESLRGRRLAPVLGTLEQLPGSQAQFVRIPFADVNCLPLPDDISDDKALLISDAVCSGLHACYMGDVKSGDSVIIWGLGPVGLFAARWAQLKGAKRVIGIDMVPKRLELAKQFDIEVINREGLSSEQLVNLLLGLVPGGADVVIEAVGFRYPMSTLHKMERTLGLGEASSPDILEECLTVVRKFGRVSIIADYSGYADHFPIGHVILKGLTVRAGRCPVQRYFDEALEGIKNENIDPSLVITDRIALEQAPEFYDKFLKKDFSSVKVLIKP